MPDDFISLTGLSIERLRSFCQIVEAGSAALAAKRNGILAGQLSRQIKDLEKCLGAKLFSRDGKRLKLTPAGVKLAALTNAYFGALRELREAEGQESKPLRLGAGDSIVRWILIPRFPEVLGASGGNLEIGTHRTAATLERLENGQLDVGIIRADAGTDGLDCLVFPTLHYVLMVPRSELPDKSAAGIKTVATLPFVMLTGDGQFVRNVNKLAAANGLTLQIRARVESFGLAVEAAKILNAATFVPTQAEKDFPIEQFTPVILDGIDQMDRPLAVAFDRKTAEFNTRARRFALRLSRAFESMPLSI
ncbi:MAG TPA: LysR family transcriptional regulator [Opitutaceae bacterium]|nr:LysR family transcriptional regulator [Opitutaceae bacterium]